LYDAGALARLAGRTGGLQPVVDSESRRIIHAGEESATALEVTVASYEGHVLHIESADTRVHGFDGRAVVIVFGSGEERLRLHGSLEIIRPTPPILAALHPITIPDQLQRRKSVRVPTNVAARLAQADGSSDAAVWHATTTRDLSDGGVRLRTVGDFGVGQHLRIHLALATGPVELSGEVIEVVGDGTTRIRFIEVSESDLQRLQHHSVDLQVANESRDSIS
jgi:hypothetical protein